MSVKLLSSDCVEFVVAKNVAEMNGLVAELMEFSVKEGTDDSIPLSNAEAKHLKLVLEFCEKNVNEDPSKLSKEASEWNRQFVEFKRENGKFDDDLLIELLQTANFLENKFLLKVLCERVKKCIQGKTPEQIRDEFGICQTCRVQNEDDTENCEHGKRKIAFSAEEEEKIRAVKPYEQWLKDQE